MAEISQLDKEIDELSRQKSRGWGSTYTQRYKNEEAELKQIKAELNALQNTYREWYSELIDDDDRSYYMDNYTINREKQAAVADQEAVLVAKLKEVEAKYEKAVQKVKADYEKDFSTQSQSITDKTNLRKDRQERKNASLKAIIEEDKAELEKIIENIHQYADITPKWDKINYQNGKIYFPLVSPTFTFDFDPWEEVEFDGNEPYLDIDNLIDQLNNDIMDDGYIFDVLAGTGIDETVIAALGESDIGELLAIPGSSWKFLFDVELDYNEPSISYYYRPGSYWEPDDSELDCDDLKYNISCFLVKEI